jgi:chromosome segregation ATPase
MDLQKKLEALEEEHHLLEIEIRAQEDKVTKLQYRRSDLEDEIMQTKQDLVKQSGDLNETEKLVLKEDLDQIGHMLSGLREGYSMNLAIIDHQIDTLTHETTISGKLSNFKVTIATSSEIVKSIIRKCFTQKAHCYGEEESELEKTTRTEWYNGPYSCCSRNFKYNVEQTKVLYDEGDKVQKERYDRWIRVGKNAH